MSGVVGLHAREIRALDGSPTVEVEVWLESGIRGRASVPSEAVSGRRGAPVPAGEGIRPLLERLNERVLPDVLGLEAADPRRLDAALRGARALASGGVPGVGAASAISAAAARAAAAERGIPLFVHLGGTVPFPLPLPSLPLARERGTQWGEGFEIRLLPGGERSVSGALDAAFRVAGRLRRLPLEVGTIVEGLECLQQAIREAGFREGDPVSPALALDVRASRRYGEEGRYSFPPEGISRSSEQLFDLYAGLSRRFPLRSLEDPLAPEDPWDWGPLLHLGRGLQVMGNLPSDGEADGPFPFDGFILRPEACWGVSDVMETTDRLRWAGRSVLFSRGSGASEDTLAADLAVATGAGQIRADLPGPGGSPLLCNRLLRIEEEWGGAGFAGFTRLRART